MPTEHRPHPVEALKRENILRAESLLKGESLEAHPGHRYWLCVCGRFHPTGPSVAGSAGGE